MIWSKDEKSHLETIEELFKRLTANGLAISPSKCEFGSTSLEFLGYYVDGKGIKPLEK